MTHHEIRIPAKALLFSDNIIELMKLKEGTTITSCDEPFILSNPDGESMLVFRFVTEHPDDPEPIIELRFGDN